MGAGGLSPLAPLTLGVTTDFTLKALIMLYMQDFISKISAKMSL